MGRLFGTDGVRGQANVAPMDSETIMGLGRAAAHVLGQSTGRHRVLIGKDTRISGYMIETALASGLTSMGMDVILCGPLPTPGISFMTRSMRADAGVMISASHNPYEDNGIKFFGHDGFKLADETEDEIESLLDPEKINALRASPEKIGKAYRIEDAVGRYTVYLKSCIEKTVKFDGLRVVLDTANGAAYRVAADVFSELGAEIVTRGDNPDGKNINQDCGSLHPEVMVDLVKKHRADCGIAYDGDADRVVMCDENGSIMDGDLLLALCAIDAKERGELKGDAVVGTVMSNMGLEKALEKHGIGLKRSGVGDRYVLAEMVKHGINFGGEQSGHVITLDHNTTGDGILTSLLTLAIAVKKQKPMSNFSGLIEKFPQELINVRVKEKIPFEELPAVTSCVAAMEEKLGSSGRVLLRYSGTEKKARVMVECEDAKLCSEVALELTSVVEQALK